MNFKRFVSLLPDNPLCGISTYKDELNLGTGVCVRQIKKLVLTGQESGTWTQNHTITIANAFYNEQSIIFPNYSPNKSGYCTHFATATSSTVREGIYWGVNINFITDINDNIDSAAKWKQYLADQYAAGTPVTVWYVLATSTTETITVPTGLSGTEEGYLNQSGTPTPTNPIYPTANEVKVWHDLTDHIMSTTWQDGSTYSRSGGSWSSSLTKKRSRKKK